MKPFKSTSILLFALALAACESNDPNPDQAGGKLLPITTGTASFRTEASPGRVAPMRSATRADAPALLHEGGGIWLYTTDDEEIYEYNLFADGKLKLYVPTPPMAYIGRGLPAHAYGAVKVTDTSLGNVFVRTTATTHPVVAGAGADEASISLVLSPAAARIRIKIKGCYGETEAENAALAPSITLNPDIFYMPKGWTLVPNPGQDFPAKLNSAPVDPFTGTSPQLIPRAIAANGAPYMFTLKFDDDGTPYANHTYTVLIPAGGITLEAAKTHVYTVALKGGSQLAPITDVQIARFDDEENTEWRTHKRGIYSAAELVAFAEEWNAVANGNNNLSSAQEAVLARWGVKNAAGRYVISLHNDITLAEEWTPIQLFAHAEFTGAGHTIRGLQVDQGSIDFVGLFMYVMKTATVSNLTLDAPQITGNAFVGAIAGTNDGNITACTVTGGNIEATLGNAGGIIGSNDGNITACTVTGVTVKAISNIAGGIIGANYGSTTACIVTAATINANAGLGAIAGSSSTTITACYRHATDVTLTGYTQNSHGTAFASPAEIDIDAMNTALNALTGNAATPYRWKAGAGAGSYPVAAIP